MKQTQRLTTGLIASAVALAMICTVTAQTAVDGSVKVVKVKGPARYSTGNNVWQPLKAGAVLKAGTIVQTSTEAGSYADLVLGEGDGSAIAGPSQVTYTPSIPNSMNKSGYQAAAEENVVRIWENTALGIDKVAVVKTGADVVTDTQLDLKAGRITGTAKKMSAASKYEIKLPNGVAGIRGGSFDISADGVVKVVVGSVVLAWVNPKTGEVVTQVVNGGNQYDARTAQMGPIPPSDLGTITGTVAAMTAVRVGSPPLTYAPDRTVIPVSPVTSP